MILGRAWWSWGSLGLVIAAVAIGVIFMHGNQLSSGWRWGVTIGFAVITITIALLNDVAKVLPETDRGAVDYYTLAHFSAGLAFGAWFMPLWFVVVVTVGWEFYEKYVPGWGENEPFVNRAVDVGVALIGWLIVTGIASHGHPPLLWSAT